MVFLGEVLENLFAYLSWNAPMHVVHDVLKGVRPILRLHVSGYSWFSLCFSHHDFDWLYFGMLVNGRGRFLSCLGFRLSFTSRLGSFLLHSSLLCSCSRLLGLLSFLCCWFSRSFLLAFIGFFAFFLLCNCFIFFLHGVVLGKSSLEVF